jgi:predicted GNAT family acetyltransferase
LARYGTEQLKSLVESMNEILEGEGVGSTFANGLLKGIRNVIAGPGAIAAFFTLFKLIQNSFTYLAQALPQIAGITTETQNRKNIEQSILQIMQQQGPVSQALAGSMGNQAAQAQLLLQLARQQTAEYQIQSTLAKQLATQLAGQGVRVKGSGGLQVTRAGGYIPAATRMAETVGAQAGGYAPGKVVKSPVGGVMNTAEDVKYVPGFAQPFINPPAGSKAGRAHRQNAISRTGVDPYMNSGFIPNFGNPKNVIDKSYTGHLNLLKIDSLKEKKQIQEVADLETEITNKLGKKEVINDKITGFGIKYDIEEIKGKSNATYRKEAADLALSGNIAKIKESMPANKTTTFNATQWAKNLKDLKNKGIDLSSSNIENLSRLENKVPSLVTGKTVEFGRQFTGLLSALSGEAFEKDIGKQKEKLFARSRKSNARLDFESSDKLYSGGEAKLGGITLGNLVAKAIESTGRKYENGEEDKIAFSKSIKLFVPEEHKLLNKGFIPNFAPPISMLRIPWFKKYANPSFDAKQPTLNIAGANAVDTFRSTQFRTNKTDYNKKAGDGNIFGPIYEKFVRSSISLQANKSKIKSLILGQSLEPDTIQGESSFDSFMELVNTNPTDLLDLVGIEIKGGPKDSQSGGSATGIITKKYNNFTTKNPKAAARLRELLGVFNEPGNPQHLQYMSALGKEFLPLAATNYDEIAKNSPELIKVLSQKTNELLASYVNNPSFYRAEASGGFIPNFASMISSSIKGKGNISAIKTGKNNYEIEGVEVGKKFRGQGLGSQLYGSIAEKIGSGSTIKSVLLPQEQALADYASGKSIPAKAIFPQLSWAKMAKSSKLLINGKEIAMSDFENGIAGHKYNAAKLDMALIELVNSHASGFIPNFAYKQAVMGLEESMSGEKAVFDTKPFPHIRNKSQPTFSSAISDHGGLSNALSDSMRGQKNAGLMNKGYVPNFAAPQNNRDFDVVRFSSLISKSVDDFGKKLSNKIIMVRESILLGLDLMNTSFDPQKIERSTESTAKKIISSISGVGNEFVDTISSSGIDAINNVRNKFTRQNASQSNGGASSQRLTAAQMAASFGNLPTRNEGLEKFTQGLSKASAAISIAGPMLAGFAEQAIYGDKKRTEMTSVERMGQSALSTGLSSLSTGAGIGASFGLPGVIIGGAIGGLVGLTSALNAATLSAEELGQLNQEQTQKSQASISAASSYIEAQKSLTQMISSGASSSDIENASKKLSNNFNEIADVKLQEIFNATGGDVKKMTEELQKYTNEAAKKSALQKGTIEKTDVKTTASSLGFGLDKNQRTEVIKQLREAASFKNITDSYGSKITKARNDRDKLSGDASLLTAEMLSKTKGLSSPNQLAVSLLEKRGLNKGDSAYDSEYKAILDKFSSMTIDQLKELADSLEKTDLVSGVGQSINRLNSVATKSFNQIFLEIEQQIAKSAFDIALSFEKDSGARKIQSTILDFSMNFQDSINSFLSNNLPDARKFDFTAATAGQKAEMLLQKSQQDYDKAIAEQGNEKAIFLNKSSKDLTASFKSSFLPSQKSAEFFEKNVFNQLKQGTFTGDARSLAGQMQNEAFSNAATKTKAVGFNLNNLEDVDSVLKQVTDKMTAISTVAGTTGEEYKKLESVLESIQELNKQTALYTNDNEVKKLQGIIDESMREKVLFEQKQANAKKELEINKQLNEAKIAVDKDIAIEKAKVDKQILMRMESMKDVSAQIGNTLELSKANINASIAALQSNLEDSRQNYGKGSSQILERKIDIQDSILKQQRELEDQTIKSEIQQRILQMAAEQENTAATLKLNDTIMTLVESQLSEMLGGSATVQEMQNNPYARMTDQQINSSTPTSYEDMQLREKALSSYSPQQRLQFEALQRIQESRTASASINDNYNTSNFAANMETAGFNKTDENGNLMMSTQEQINFLSKEELKAKEANNIVLEGTIKRYKEEIRVKEKSLSITRDQLDKSIALKNEENRAMVTFSGRLSAGFGKLSDQADNIIHNLAEELPMKFADNMSSALMEVAKGTKSIGDAFQDMAINFGQMIMQEVMRAAIAKTLGNIGIGSLFGQAGGNVSARGIGYQHGGVIRANNGQYVSGMGSGDRYPAMLENGEYVLNRKAVKELGGKKSLDAFNFQQAPRFASGGNVNMEAEMALNKDQEMDYTKNLLYNNSNVGAINEKDYTAYAYSENDYFKKMREKAIADEQKRVQKAFDKKQKNAQLISSTVGAVGSMFLAAGMSGLANSGVSAAKPSAIQAAQLKKAGVTMNPSGLPNMQRGGVMHFANGGFVPHGSRLSDTIPALLTGGEYVMNNAAVRKYGLGEMNAMNAGAVSNNSNSNATNTNNNTNNNATNISINIDRSGKATYGSDTSSYEKNDIAFSKQMAKRVADIAKGVISDETRYGGKINQR